MASRVFQMSPKVSFVAMILLTSSFFLVEVIVGYVTNSMALVADSFHMLSDVASLIVGFLALRYSKVGKQAGRYTFGWARAEILGALVNAVFLVALCFSIFVEALKRIVLPEPIATPRLVILVGGIGLLVNLIGLFLFHQHGHSHGHGGHRHGDSAGHARASRKGNSRDPFRRKLHANHSSDSKSIPESMIANTSISAESRSDGVPAECPLLPPAAVADEGAEDGAALSMDGVTLGEDLHVYADTVQPDVKSNQSSTQLNIRGVYLHVLGDALGSVIVMISAVIVLFESGRWTLYVDPVMSILMVAIIMKTSVPLLKETSMILMQTVPTHLKIQEIQTKLVEEIPGVLGVHEFHIWQLAGNKIIASAHVRCRTLADYMAIANQVKEFFHNEGIHSTTIQPEFIDSGAFQETGLVSNGTCLVECGPDKNCAESTCCGPVPEKDARKKRNGDSAVVTPCKQVCKPVEPVEPAVPV